MWISHVPQSWTPSHIPPKPIPQVCPKAPALSSLSDASDLDLWTVSYMAIYMFQLYPLKSSHPCFHLQNPKVCCCRWCCCCCCCCWFFLNICVSFAALHIESLLASSQTPYVCFFFFLTLFFFIVVNFVIQWNETAMGLHVFPILIPPLTSFSTQSL